ncbi:MAG: hypothetical protein RBU29_04180 [bacterium]|nr:hypothetical protein [bacterium]
MMSLSSIYLNKVTEETFEEVVFNVSVAVSGTARTVKRGRTEGAPSVLPDGLVAHLLQ